MNISSAVLLAAVAGISFLGFLLLAALVWMIRIRRSETGDAPAPTPGRSAQNAAAAGRKTASTEGKPWKEWIRNLAPGISTLMELDAMVKRAETSNHPVTSKEEKQQAFFRAVEELAEKEPDNAFLRQMRDSIRKSFPNMGNSAQVFRIGTANTINVDGEKYPDLESIPDPEKREKVRQILKKLGSGNLSDQ
jgi:hypothetical protein